jgi:photosystem II stability/assembly factor-like uncharacterized protein
MLKIAATLLMTASLASTAGAASWAPTGPTGGDVRALASDPRDPQTLFLGTADGFLYRSGDTGQSWLRQAPGFPKRGQSLDNIAVDPRGRLLVGYWDVEGKGGGVARSLDGGRTFEVLTGIAGESVRALAIAPSNPDILVAGAISGVFRSDDGGDSWRRISPPGHAELRNVESVAIDPKNPQVAYVGTWHLPWKTLDGGKTWRLIHTGMIDDSDVFTITLDRRSPSIVYATACSGIYRSGDGAGRWAKVRGIPGSSRRTRALAQDAQAADTIYAGTTEGLFVSEDGTGSWRLATAKDLVVNTIAALPDVLLIGTDGAGVLRSTDGGRSFAPANSGFSEHLVSRVLFQPGSARLVVGVSGDRFHSGVLTAAATGGPWTKLGEGLEGREVLALTLAGAETLAGTDDGIFVSVSHCGLWRRLPTLVGGVEAHPRAADVAAVGDSVFLAATDQGLLRSADAGETWQRQRLGLANAILAVAASPRTPGLAVAATPLGFFKSRDGGGSWQQVSQGLEAGTIHSLAFLAGDDRIVFAATKTGLLRSADQGRTWERRGAGLPLSDIAGLAFAPDGRTVYASDFTNGGVFTSADAGDSWTRFPTAGLVSDRVFAMAVDPKTVGRLLAGAAAGGLHVFEAGASGPTPAGDR